MSKITELKKQINAARDEARKTFASAFGEIFDKYPKVKTIGWPQYTPYFNDGDVCEFYSHHEYCQYINGISIDDSEDLIDELGFVQEDFDFISNKVCDIVGEFDSDDLKYMFGEGLVVVNRNGTVEVEDYDHE